MLSPHYPFPRFPDPSPKISTLSNAYLPTTFFYFYLHTWPTSLTCFLLLLSAAPTASSSSTTCCTFYCNCNCLQFCTTTPTTIRPIRPLEPKRDPTDLDFLQSFVPPSILHFRSSHTIPSHCLSRPNCIGTQTQPTHTPTTLVPHISTEHLPPNFHLKYSYQTLPSS